MCSQDVEMRTEPNKKILLYDSDNLLVAAGLCVEPLCLPLFSLYDMFEAILKHKKATQSLIRKKLTAFYYFVSTGQIQNMPFSLSAVLVSCGESIREDLRAKYVFFNSSIVAMFAYVFNVRLELYLVGREGLLSCQYFGVKKKPVKRVYMADESFCILKKSLLKTNTLSTRVCSDTELLVENPSTNYRMNRKLGAPKQTQRKQNYCEPETPHLAGFWTNQCNQDSSSSGSLSDEDSRCMMPDMYSLSDDSEKSNKSDKSRKVMSLITSQKSPSNPPLNLEDPDSVNVEAVLNSWAKDIKVNGVEEGPLGAVHTFAKEHADPGLGVTHRQVEGKLKFYSEVKEYGFVIMEDGTEVFAHKADLVKQNINTAYLAYYRKFYDISVKFDVEEYQGKTKVHRKAINLQVLDMTPIV